MYPVDKSLSKQNRKVMITRKNHFWMGKRKKKKKLPLPHKM